jgi:hypothetical protein
MTPSETATAYEELIAAIVKAVPDIRQNMHRYGDCSWCWNPSRTVCERPITLEDVLRACPKSKPRLVVSIQGEFLIVSPDVTDTWYSSNKFPKWSLGKPLSEQSDELKSFLHSLLV